MLAPTQYRPTDLSPLPQLLTGKPTFHSLPPVNLQKATKKEISEYFENAFDLNETLFTCVKYSHDFYVNPDELRLILMFYLVHPASLFVNKLMLTGALNERIDVELETMCETGVDEMSWDDAVTVSRIENRGFSWPTIERAMEYRAKVRKLILNLIENHTLELPITQTSQNGFWWAILLSVEHERIHIETSSCLLRQLPVDRIQFPPLWQYAPATSGSPVSENNFIPFSGKMVRLGKPENFPFYGWCNEYGKTDIQVPDFQVQQFEVTNRQYLQFVNGGGYHTEKYWSKEGWKWRKYVNRDHPLWWVKENQTKSGDEPVNETKSNYRYRAMFSIIDMPLDWPVDVNYHEAKAYCNWLGEGYRLPCESEYWIMRGLDYYNTPAKAEDEFTFSGSIDNLQANGYLKYASSTPVNMFPPNSNGLYDLFGNVWEWCEDHFNGFDGFKSHFIYDDYASPCFDGRHNVIVGGSWISTGDESSIFSRYGFRRHFMQHAGFRVVKSDNAVPVRLVSTNVFILGSKEDDPVIPPIKHLTPENFQPSANAQIEYDTPARILKTVENHFLEPSRQYHADFVEKVIERATRLKVVNGSVLDVGCEVGSSCFYLSKHFQKVKGVDYCGRNIEWAMRLLHTKSFKQTVSDDLSIELSIPTESQLDRIQFYQLTWLPVEVGSHNLVIFNNNYINRVNTPKSWLYRLREIVLPGGIAILTHSVSNNTSSIDVAQLQQLIGNHFDLNETFELAAPSGATCVSV